jgi:glycosyltransferase involved in cell wall biosynthesis
MHTLAAIAGGGGPTYSFARGPGRASVRGPPPFGSSIGQVIIVTRVLIVSPLRAPDPARDHHGVYQRLRLFVSALAAEHGAVDIAHFARPEEATPSHAAAAAVSSTEFWRVRVNVHLLPLDMSARPGWAAAAALASLRHRGDFRPYLGRAAMEALRALLDARPDAVFAHRLVAMEALRRCHIAAPVLFDLDDVEHLVKARAAASARGLRRRIRLRLEAKELAKAERRAIGRANLTFVCSDCDRSRLADEGFDIERVAVAANAVPMPAGCPPRMGGQSALYLGNFGHAPNAEAAERLITLVWPQVRAVLTHARLIIAGAQPERIPSFREEPEGVFFTGLVDDLDALYAGVGIVCCPLVNGGGTRVKLIEAAARGVPIVATPMAAEGLSLTDGRDILLRQDDVGLAQACVALLADGARADAQAQAAFRAVAQMHDPARVAAGIRAAVRQSLGAAVRPRPARPGADMTIGPLRTDAAKR